jgi:hypothetical protein
MEIVSNLTQDHQRIGFTARLTVNIGPGTKSLFKENSMKFLKFLKDYYRDLTPAEVIQRELAQAHLDRLEAEGAVEYAQAVLDLNLTRIERLNTRLKEYKQ